ncbi:glutamine-hydrolyzing GMP synthase [Candidatus Liberibacter asiaticus]|uniref:GMP synthase [glutamine-hydrolyzing] n=2 Tax=Liberibacter asiaticus TaxID=34021 RepID=C6XHZ4_LIBAP|nr:glutamine-hydrolyzing GMP synthase [Candidatus Liberibacter asiaticus]ACT56887.1 GMP synthase [Candidatus Liberibacter asiaticus str. psy62]AGH16651.1 GMP synthase [Candidatus Liberibacter asiaticus str. gxpsy]ALK07037.1 glutamine-hydrolyzing GMP synthase [Candidatus Liberibacter asiaticus]ASK52507.1 GMP synthase (glutamine-hydrolyzing) [Candidatus Liberibacter asiaticus]AWL13832.1 glutamine-hydrolyzing GMP synthase [Candidatus Liberibacter asiaticus]
MHKRERSSKVLIIDFGSQFTQLIARRVRESKVYCEVIAFKNALDYFKEQNPQAIILSGSPASSLDIDSPQIPKEILESNIPLLGICYGQQIMCQSLGGKTKNSQSREFGRAFIEIKKNCSLLKGMWEKGSKQQVWMSHGDQVEHIPEGFEVIASSDSTPFAFIADEKRKYYAVQFHPEVVHTVGGSQLIDNFVHHVAGIQDNWVMSSYHKEIVSRIKEQVGNERVICAVSGGVDSTVAAFLIYEAIGINLTCVLVDHGFMRKNEVENIISLFKGYPNFPLRVVDASERFIRKLKNIVDPETKRKVIGQLFIEVFEEEAKKIGGAQFLGQGTLYPDVIESISFFGGPSSIIKSHHNVGGLPEHMDMKLVEPLKELFKDEVRLLGKELRLPDSFVERHPCPGPGLAIRCIGEITEERINILRESDAIYREEIHKAGIYRKIWQAFTVLLPVQTVGVMGDERTYEYVCSLRAVTSIDGMTADFYHHDMNFLSQVAIRIVNEVKGINRVVYDITSKPPATIEWE